MLLICYVIFALLFCCFIVMLCKYCCYLRVKKAFHNIYHVCPMVVPLQGEHLDKHMFYNIWRYKRKRKKKIEIKYQNYKTILKQKDNKFL